MNDFDAANKKIGNRFDLVLVASERMRELHKQRRDKEELGNLTVEQRRKEIPPHWQAINDVETGLVDRTYLEKLKSRGRKRQRFDSLG